MYFFPILFADMMVCVNLIGSNPCCSKCGEGDEDPSNTCSLSVPVFCCKDMFFIRTQFTLSFRLQLFFFLVFSNEKRERGNYLYARNDCIRAINVYEKYVRIVMSFNTALGL